MADIKIDRIDRCCARLLESLYYVHAWSLLFFCSAKRKVTKEKAALRHAAPPGSGATLRVMLSFAVRLSTVRWFPAYQEDICKLHQYLQAFSLFQTSVRQEKAQS